MRLPDKVTVWHPTGNDGLGGRSYDGPFVIDARTALKQEKFTDENGDQQISKSVCYSDSENLKAKALVYFGESQAVEPLPDADDVRAVSATPSGTDMRKAWL